MAKYLLINEQNGKRYERATLKSAEHLQNEKALNGVDLTIYEYDEKLKTYVLADQILFHTAKSLLFLDYEKTEEISCK